MNKISKFSSGLSLTNGCNFVYVIFAILESLRVSIPQGWRSIRSKKVSRTKIIITADISLTCFTAAACLVMILANSESLVDPRISSGPLVVY